MQKPSRDGSIGHTSATSDTRIATIKIIDINDASGKVITPEWFAKAESVHRQLRTHLPPDYAAKMQRVFADGGRMCVAVRGDRVEGVAVYRIYENTFDGLHMYVDDLVTDDTRRSTGVGKALMDHLQDIARKAGCEKYTLDSGTQRTQAHKFYFREGMTVLGFHFAKPLK
ncbi:MAG: GNAT family N-acetyltransferase [Planctomycetes bacterium]|nr:GNAT family N-acetyltransferase [Planctomycetota bacterium]